MHVTFDNGTFERIYPYVITASVIGGLALAAFLSNMASLIGGPRRLRVFRRARVALQDGRRRVLVVCTGSVAAVKTPEIVRSLIEDHGVYVDLILTRSGEHFMGVEYKGHVGWELLNRIDHQSAGDGTRKLEVWRDEDEWADYRRIGDPVLHIDLAKRNSVLLVAPLCANALAAHVNGDSSTLAMSVRRAWPYDLEDAFAHPVAARCGAHVVTKPMVVAPAMNTIMWHQKITQAQLVLLREQGVSVVEPVEKVLACGDTGKGAMADVGGIVAEVCRLLHSHEEAVAQAQNEGRPAFL